MSILKKYDTDTGQWIPIVVGTDGPTGPTGADAVLGAFAANQATGMIAHEFRVYDRALTTKEIQHHASVVYPKYGIKGSTD